MQCEKLVKAEKKMLMKEFCRMVENQMGRFLQPGQLQQWVKNIGKIQDALNNTRKKKSRISTNISRKSQLELFKDEILFYVNTMQEQDKTVLTRLVCCLCKTLLQMSLLYELLYCFCHHQALLCLKLKGSPRCYP